MVSFYCVQRALKIELRHQKNILYTFGIVMFEIADQMWHKEFLNLGK